MDPFNSILGFFLLVFAALFAACLVALFRARYQGTPTTPGIIVAAVFFAFCTLVISIALVWPTQPIA
jgi:hypothetical protein